MQLFLEKLQLVAHEPLTYVAFLVLVGAWLWRAYFLRTKDYIASLKTLPERDQLSGLQLLALGYPQKVTANQLKLLQQRYFLIAFVATLVCVIILAGLTIHYWSLPADEVKKRLGHIEEQGNKAADLLMSIDEKMKGLDEQKALLQEFLALYEEKAKGTPEAPAPPAEISQAKDRVQAELESVKKQLAEYVRLYGELPRPQIQAQLGQAEQAVRDAEELLGVFRKDARSSVANAPVATYESLDALLETLPSDEEMRARESSIDSKSPRIANENRNVKVSVCYLYAFKREISNDIRLILGSSKSTERTRYMIANISGLPQDGRFRDQLRVPREQFRQVFGEARKAGYRILSPPLQVQVTGSLLYSTLHPPGTVGPVGLRSATAWSIHPVTDIVFGP
jgi:hypothetical protein